MRAAWGDSKCEHFRPPMVEVTTKLWLKTVADLPEEKIRHAMDKCIELYSFPPSIAEFKRAAYDILPVDHAYEAKNTNRIAQEAWCGVDDWLKKTAPEKEVKAQFVASYKYLCERILTGEIKR